MAKRKTFRDRPAENLKVVFGIFFFVSLGLVLWGATNWIRFQPSLQWPSVPGVVLHSDYSSLGGNLQQASFFALSHGSHTSGAHVTYRYAVNGNSYVSSQIALWSSDLVGGTGRPYQFVQEHPVGTSVLVYYDPRDPQNAVLIPGADTFTDRLLMWSGAGAAALSLLAYFNQIRMLRREYKAAKELPPLEF